MYMREMGTVELLTREGEIDIAKRIEDLSMDEICSRLEKLAQKARRLSAKYAGGEIAAKIQVDNVTEHP